MEATNNATRSPSGMNNDLLYLPAQVRAVGDAARIAHLAQILRSERALDPSVLEEHSPFFWRAEISNTRLDAYFTHMLLSSLRNYAREAAAGVAFLPGHNHRHLPIGGSLTGELSEENAITVVRSDFYTLSGMVIGEVSTNGLIASIRGGLTRDNSIGWYGGKLICDICGQDYWRGRCPHIAGFTYEEEKEGVIRQILATVGIDDAHLAEVSGVYDGATPGAMIDKIYQMASAGEMSTEQVRYAEVIYRLDKEVTQRMLALPAVQKKHASVEMRSTPDTESGDSQASREDERMQAEQFTQMVDTLIRAGALTEAQRETCSDADALAAVGKVTKRVAELEPLAADGEQYRKDLIAETLAEGVRAYGADKFAHEKYDKLLRSMPLEDIKQMKTDWAAIGNSRFAPGRQTTDPAPDTSAESGEGKEVEIRAPAKVYG